MIKSIKVLVVIARIALGCLFIYAGIQKFIPRERPKVEQSEPLPDHVVRIKSFIGGLKQTGYFWPFLGVAEILAGVLLVSQYLALMGAFVLAPITLNIFLFHLFLEPHEVGELFMTGLYFTANILIILYHYSALKPAFLNFKLN